MLHLGNPNYSPLFIYDPKCWLKNNQCLSYTIFTIIVLVILLIARKANAEDNCTGRFWEGRYKVQALLDEAALAACLAYIDLNPVRAKMATTPETSAHTSISLRIKSAKEGKQPFQLSPFVGNPKKEMPQGLPFPIEYYLESVDLTGRCIRQNKRGYIDNALPNILTRLNISTENWLKLTTGFEHFFKGASWLAKLN